MDLYIYYHAAIADADAVQAAVARLQQQLRARPGSGAPSGLTLRCGLKRRPRVAGTNAGEATAAADVQPPARDTWMEIYLAVPEPFAESLAAAVAESTLPSLIDGNRHVEIFVDALPCA